MSKGIKRSMMLLFMPFVEIYRLYVICFVVVLWKISFFA